MADDIGRKVEHVKAARGSFGHHCHWPDCTAKVPPAMWGCKRHWYALPLTLRRAIWRTYRPGQEIDKRPSAEYLAVAASVQAWIANNSKDLFSNG